MELKREQIIKDLQEIVDNYSGSWKRFNVLDNVLSLINELTEENERLRAEGEWLPQFEGARIVKCSVCGYEYCDLIECGNYCGNCGAKMKGGE